MNFNNLKVGDSFWAVTYNAAMEKEIKEWVFIALVDNYIIASYQLGGCYDNLKTIMDEQMKSTYRDGVANNIAVFLASDCYLTKNDAMKSHNLEFTFPDCPICANMNDEGCYFDNNCIIQSENGIRYGTPSHWGNF